jgi:signal peptidase I
MNKIKNILLICFLLFLFSCNTIKAPTYIGFENLKIETLNFNNSNLTVDVKYYNPNNFSLDVHKSDLNFYINDKLLAHSTQEFEIKIPKKGEVITLTAQNIALYKRLIADYEHNTLEESNGKYFINGKQTNQYTPIYNYYWMMGDNRHRSQDSRYWGFVPETHIVGKASLIWFSYENGPRWKRLFNSIK